MGLNCCNNKSSQSHGFLFFEAVTQKNKIKVLKIHVCSFKSVRFLYNLFTKISSILFFMKSPEFHFLDHCNFRSYQRSYTGTTALQPAI